MTYYIVRHKPTGVVMPGEGWGFNPSPTAVTLPGATPRLFGSEDDAKDALAFWYSQSSPVSRKTPRGDVEIVPVELAINTEDKVFTLQLAQHQFEVRVPWHTDSCNMLARMREQLAEHASEIDKAAYYAKDVMVIPTQLGSLR